LALFSWLKRQGQDVVEQQTGTGLVPVPVYNALTRHLVE
jgi:hypothetical protein